jgi:hypothetical protein
MLVLWQYSPVHELVLLLISILLNEDHTTLLYFDVPQGGSGPHLLSDPQSVRVIDTQHATAISFLEL